MSIKTRLASFLGMEHRADGYTNAAIDALLGPGAWDRRPT